MIINQLGTLKQCGIFHTENCHTTFDGVNEKLDVPNTSWSYGREWNQPITVSIWFKKVDGGLILPLGRWIPNPSTQGWFTMVINPGKMRYQLRTAPTGVGKWMDLTSTAIFPIINDNWNHALWTDDGSGTEAGVEMYLDGVPSAHPHSFGAGKDMVNSGTIKVSTMELGGLASQPWFSNGALQHLAVWDRVLTPAEVTIVFGKGRDGVNYSDISGLQMHRKLNNFDFFDVIEGTYDTPVGMDASNIVCE